MLPIYPGFKLSKPRIFDNCSICVGNKFSLSIVLPQLRMFTEECQANFKSHS